MKVCGKIFKGLYPSRFVQQSVETRFEKLFLGEVVTSQIDSARQGGKVVGVIEIRFAWREIRGERAIARLDEEATSTILYGEGLQRAGVSVGGKSFIEICPLKIH